jgi:uncharacterized membrane-anchored protein YjiN (DUF445 family)
MTDYKATPEQWAQCEDWVRSSVVGASDACILELRARVETLEAAARKHIAETSSNILALASRVESLEAAERQASKVYEISKPLKLTAKQQEELNALLRPSYKPSPNSPQIGSSLVERVEGALMESIKEQGSMARAAIREVAKWMREQQDGDLIAATMLEREVER